MADIRDAIKKAYKSTVVYQLDQLKAEETHWQRRITIAHNKLRVTRRRINKLADELAQRAVNIQ